MPAETTSTPSGQHYLLGYDAFGNMTSAQVCASSAEREGHTAPVTLASYTYEGNVNNGRLATMTYGNGDSVSYTYDAFDRQRTAAYNDGTTYHYDYSGDNDLARQYVTDGSGAVTEQYSYQYDSLGRLIHSRQSTGGGTLVQLTQHMYDNANRLTSQSWQFGGDTFRQSYTYTGQNSDGKQVDGTISAITTTIPDQLAITSKYEYNDLRQLEKKTVTVPDQNGTQTKVYDRTYTYAVIAEDDGCNRMGTRLASTGYTFGSSSRGFTYTYDAAGNISRIVTAGTSVPKAGRVEGVWLRRAGPAGVREKRQRHDLRLCLRHGGQHPQHHEGRHGHEVLWLHESLVAGPAHERDGKRYDQGRPV